MAQHIRLIPDTASLPYMIGRKALMAANRHSTHHVGSVRIPTGTGHDLLFGEHAKNGANWVNDDGVQLPLLDTSGIESQISRADSQISIINNNITQVNNQLSATNKAIDAQTAKMQAQAQAITAQAAKDKAALETSIGKLQTQADQTAKQAADDKSALQASIGKLQSQSQAITAQAAKDKAAVDDSVSALTKRMASAENTAQDLSKHLTDVQSTVNGQASTLTAFDQRISANASSGDATAKLASSLQQTVQSLSATLTQTTKTANDALTQANTVQATAKQISDTLTTDYTTSKDSDAKYATQAALKATSDSVSAQFSAQAKTNKGYDTQIASIQATAQGITQRLSDVTKTADSTQTTLTQYKAAQDQLSTTLTKTTQTAQGAVTAAAKAQATADGISLNLSKSYTTSKDADAKYATQASLKATSDSMSAQFTAQAKTNKGYETQIASIQATAQGITQQLSDVTKTANSTQSTVTTLKQTVDGNTSQIKQTTDTAQGLLTKTQQLSDSINGVKLNLSSNYATKTDVANISVGGTNLLCDTSNTQTFKGNNTQEQHWSPWTLVIPFAKLEAAGQYTLSFDYTYTGTVPSAGNGAWLQLNAEPWWPYRKLDLAHPGHFVFTATIANPCGTATSLGVKLCYVPGVLTISHIKLEKGNKATDWSPAPQDLQPAGDYATSKNFAQYQATVQGLSAQIGQVAKTAQGTQSDVNSIKVTAKGLQASLSDVTKTADSTSKSLTQYKATQDQLSAQLSKTTSTAQGAVTAAAKAQATADGISLNLSKNYTSAKDADAKYATQAALKTTSDGITAQFSKTSSSIAGIQHDVNSIKVDATGIHGTLTQITNGQGVTNKTVKSIQDTVSGMQSTLTSTTQTANSALTNTTTLKTGLNSVNLTMSQHYQQMLANTQQGENLIPNGNADPNAEPFYGWKIVNNAYEVAFPGKQNHVDFVMYRTTHPILAGHTYRFSVQARVTAGKCSGSDYIAWGFGPSWTDRHINLAGVGADWVTQSFDLPVDANQTAIYMSSFVGSAGAKTIQFRALSVIDVTAAAQAQTAAGTALTKYASLSADLNGFKSSVGQTYLPKGDAAKTYTTNSQVQQTAQGLSARINTTTTTIAGIQRDVNSIKVDATGIHGTLTQITDSQGVTNKTVKSIQDTVSGLQSTLTSTTNTANSALTNTTTLKTGLDSVNLTMSQHYQQMLANTQMGENLIPNGNADPNAEPFNGWKINQHAYEVVFPGGQNHVDFVWYHPVHPILAGHTYRFSVQARVTSGTCSGSDHIEWGFGPSWNYRRINLAGVGADWVTQSFDLSISADQNLIYMSSYIGSAGAKTIQFRALSVIDITPAAQAQSKAGDAYNRAASVSADLTGFKTSVSQTYLPKSDAAKTYTTSSQVQQAAKQISAQVVSDYKGADGSGLATQSSLAATKKDILAQVSQTYTTKDGVTQQLNSKVQQTADSLTTTFTNQLNTVKTQASNTQTQVNTIQAMIREDSAGIHVGRLVNGKQVGYSALVGSDGSFNVLDGNGVKYAQLKPLDLLLGTMSGKAGNARIHVDADGMGITYQQNSGVKSDFKDPTTYGMQTGNGGIALIAPDGSRIALGPGGINIHSSDGSDISVGKGGIHVTDPTGAHLNLQPTSIDIATHDGHERIGVSDGGMALVWQGKHQLATGPIAGELYLNSRQLRHV